MIFNYGDVSVDTEKTSDKEMTVHCLKAKEYQLKEEYKNFKRAKKELLKNKAEKRFMDDKQLQEYEGKKLAEEGLMYLAR